MRFLVDECTGPGVAIWLGQQGYEVFSVYDQAQGAADDALLLKAFSEGWILVTNDKDFGEMVYRERRHQGVIFLRLANERTASKIAVLQVLLDNHDCRGKRSQECQITNSSLPTSHLIETNSSSSISSTCRGCSLELKSFSPYLWTRWLECLRASMSQV